AVSGDDSVARHALLLHSEVGVAVDDELVELLKRSGIEQQRHALARRELALLVLPLDASLAAAQLAFAFAALELLQRFLFCFHNMKFRSVATRSISCVSSSFDGSRVPMVLVSRPRASCSIES